MNAVPMRVDRLPLTAREAASLPGITLARDSLGSFDATATREWIVTNGLGGFASGTVAGANTRRYHGLLVAALRPPVERTVMVAKFDVSIRYLGERVELGANEYADGTVAPRGYEYLQSFELDGQIPVWQWVVRDAVIEQRIWMAHGKNTTYVSFKVVRASGPVEFEIAPLCTYRDYHWQLRGSREFRVARIEDGIEVLAFDGALPYRLLSSNGEWTVASDWYWNFKHRAESERGLDDVEDLLRPATLRLSISAGESSTVTLTAEQDAPLPANESYQRELARQSELLVRASLLAADCGPQAANDWIRQLILAADQFIVERRPSSPTNGQSSAPIALASGHTVIAGYPWFSDWGRDTMIALMGLTLSTGRAEIAASILRTFALHVSEGMLPNRFPDAGETPEYNTVDATLWYFIAVDEYFRATADEHTLTELYPVLKEILDWHRRGTRYGIRVDDHDSLLFAGEAGAQITWMDAKIGDWVVTPRIGKPVEINALWYNALKAMQDFAIAMRDDVFGAECAAVAEQVKRNFNERFWNSDRQYLYDVIDGPEGDIHSDGRRYDASLRPNQIFAVSLRHALLDDSRARAVVDVCMRELWTPVGLRSLGPRHGPSLTLPRETGEEITSDLQPSAYSPQPRSDLQPSAYSLAPTAPEPRYAGRYTGNSHSRDAVYHQGTVWSWLLGPFALAHYHVHRDADQALAYLRGIAPHLREGCLGQISEIFDGDAPHTARGCYAQAWSVAEILRAWRELHERKG